MTLEVRIPAHPREWKDSAACQVADQNLFFPVLLPRYKHRFGFIDEAKAKALCAECSVQAQCLDWAITMNEEEGIWGGTTPEERGVTGA